MGQYYMPCNTEKLATVYSHDFDSGLKLMEHSWMKNKFVRTVESLLAKGGDWHGDPIVWCGDYADCADDYYLHDAAIKPKISDHHYRYLVNKNTGEYIDKNNVPEDDDGWQIHPLPLMTCQGNGMGGGDFHGESNLIGHWAFETIVPCDELPEYATTEIVFDLVE
jgi:hypothetical protein